MEVTETQYRNIVSKLETVSFSFGIEVHPFNIGWYNDTILDKKFVLDGPYNTLAFVVISTPSMFEKAFIPYINSEFSDFKLAVKDPLDRCMKKIFHVLCTPFQTEYDISPIHDFEINSITKRPRVLVQTAGHVAGAVRLYQTSDTQKQQNNTENVFENSSQVNHETSGKLFPVCLHPKYGGWFALRGVLVFNNVSASDSLLKLKDPPTILKSVYDINNLLCLYNYHWQDWRYRDIGMPHDVERYSEIQKEYFRTKSTDRVNMIHKLMNLKCMENV